MGENTMGWTPEARTLAASGVDYSPMFEMKQFKAVGFFSLELEMTGDGTLKVEYLLSNKANPVIGDFLKPTGVSDIITAFTKTTGPGSDGHDLYQFPVAGEAIFAKWIVLKFTETGTSDGVVVNYYPNIQ